MTLKEFIEWIKRKKGTSDIGVVDSCDTKLTKKEDKKEDEKINRNTQ